MSDSTSKLDYVFSADELRALLDNNPSATEIIIRLEMGVKTVQPEKGDAYSFITTTIEAMAKYPDGALKGLKDGEAIDGYPDPPGAHSNT